VCLLVGGAQGAAAAPAVDVLGQAILLPTEPGQREGCAKLWSGGACLTLVTALLWVMLLVLLVVVR
jgi:hypothetical protein